MISGHQTLTTLDQGLQRLRKHMESLEDRLEQTGNHLLALRRQESELYRQLAELRTETLQAGNLQQALSEAERHATELLAKRKEAMHRLATRSREIRDQQTELEQARQMQSGKTLEAAGALQARLDEIHAGLREQSSYQEQQTITQNAVNTLAASEEKTRRAEEEYRNKGKPYRDDRLFMYLWNVRYGTPDYRANAITQFFDYLLARHIRYEAARQNYTMLSNIPEKLREHTLQVKTRAEAEMQKLSAMEQAAEKTGGVEALETALAQEKTKLEKFDAEIEEKEREYAELLAEHEIYAAGEDDYLKRAIDRLAENFRTEPIPKLRREAADTVGYEDDSVVSELAELRHRKTALEQELAENRRIHQQSRLRLHDMEALRRRFKQYDFDASNSRFSDDTPLENHVDDFLRGLITADRLWNLLQHSQRFVRYRNYPSRGGVGFPSGFGLPGNIEFPDNMQIPRGIHIPGGLEDLVGGVLGGILQGGVPGASRGGGGLGGGPFRGGGGDGFHTGGGF